MTIKSVLVANRGEIAVRIIRAAADVGIRSVAVYSEDDARALHVRRADEARALSGRGPAAYLDAEQIIAAAKDCGCDAIHPGYGFLSESAAFAQRCADAGLIFVGPRPDVLELLGNKARARAFAAGLGVPVLAGTDAGLTPDDARAFLSSLGGAPIALKAVAGGGGRGMRIVRNADELDEAYERCRSEARAAFGNGDLYAERAIARARHIEVQIIGDGKGGVTHLGERDCTIQRRHQKLIEITPAFGLESSVRDRIIAAAVSMAEAIRYDNAGTFEFLVDAESTDTPFVFIEANARLQVEHTVTEEVDGDRSRRRSAPHRRRRHARRPAAAPGGLSSRRVGRRSSSASTPRRTTRRACRAPPAATSPSSSRRRAQACASTRPATPELRRTPRSTRCSRSSSCGPRRLTCLICFRARTERYASSGSRAYRRTSPYCKRSSVMPTSRPGVSPRASSRSTSQS